MSVCLIISVFCKSCKSICELEITPELYHLENQSKNNFMFSVQFTNLTKPGNKHCHEKIVLIWNTFLDFFYWCLPLVFPNLKLQNLLHFFRISLESDSAFLRDVFNNPRNKGQIGGIFLFLFKHLSWYLIKLPIFESDWWCQEHWLTTLNSRDRLVFEFYVIISTKVY